MRTAFLSLSSLYVLWYIWQSRRSYNAVGDREFDMPATKLAFWYLAGAAVLWWSGISAWHLLWWFVLGFCILKFALGKGWVRYWK